jgi:hypothetical protein
MTIHLIMYCNARLNALSTRKCILPHLALVYVVWCCSSCPCYCPCVDSCVSTYFTCPSFCIGPPRHSSPYASNATPSSHPFYSTPMWLSNFCRARYLCVCYTRCPSLLPLRVGPGVEVLVMMNGGKYCWWWWASRCTCRCWSAGGCLCWLAPCCY